MTSTYRRVPSAHTSDPPPVDDNDRAAFEQEVDESSTAAAASDTSTPRSLSERISDKIYAMGWVLVAILVAHFTRFYPVVFLMHDSTATYDNTAAPLRQPNRALLLLVAICIGINTVLFLYLTVYLPKVKGLTDSSAWPVYCPRVIPASTIFFVLSVVFLIRGCWPVWGFLTPLLVIIQMMGWLFATHLIPWIF